VFIFVKKKSFWLGLIWLIGLCRLFYHFYYLPDLQVVFCDVGQGDAILVADNSVQILIDGGPDNKVLQCLKDNVLPWDKRIELMVLTHADSDHFVGLTSVLDNYIVENLLVVNLPKISKDFDVFYQKVKKQIVDHDLKIHFPVFAENGCITDYVCWQIVSENNIFLSGNIFDENYDLDQLSDLLNKSLYNNLNYNNESIVLNLTVDDKMFSLAGDVEAKGELAMVNNGLLTKVDVLKVPHHGSKSSSTLDFLQVLQPEYSIVSVGSKNSFGHPHKMVLDNLEFINSKIFRTDISGEIKFTKNYNTDWKFSTKK